MTRNVKNTTTKSERKNSREKRKKQLQKLNIGCGIDVKPGYTNIDYVGFPGVDAVVDLEKTPYSFPSNHFDVIESHHVFEHIENFKECMEELHRISKPGAKINMSVPYFASPAYDLDITHKRKFNLRTIECMYTGAYPLSKKRVKIVRKRLFFFSCKSFMKSRWYSLPLDLLINFLPSVYERFFVYLLPASELHMILEVEK